MGVGVEGYGGGGDGHRGASDQIKSESMNIFTNNYS
jgi:hypothetical protein